jgi:hypothetical protein
MAHICRTFFEVWENHPQAAAYATGEIAKGYARERKYRENLLNPQKKEVRRREDI